MAGEARRPSPFLKSGLLEKGPRFAFGQALRLLRRVVAHEAGTRDPRAFWRRVKVRPELSLSFTASDILAITEEEGSRYRMTVAILGLYGASSPLPTFYTEDLMDEEGAHRTVTRDFLDVLNGAIYPLFFASWAKHRLFYSLVEGEDAGALERLFCLLGMARPAATCVHVDPNALLKYAGLFGLASRPAAGLRALLADYFHQPGLAIVPCVERTVAIPAEQRCRLGQANRTLGVDACLGVQAQDCMGAFRVELGPLEAEDLHRFLPGRKACRAMGELIRLYCRDGLAWDLRIRIKGGAGLGGRLGSLDWSCLGRDLWVASPGQGAALTEITFPEPDTWKHPRERVAPLLASGAHP
ncbi:type VI secretion system baseplate subunit TssG [Mesoterricola silvestris]|uniref:Type VI secretion protein n=1 Tax=Mesoterricola silvestris TaxID=2927979 RepID=A0AA48K979_9BACT|nr:type VI secretion system baseplate subunit TssG [Mesoterricola silvestris]BDU73729.1 type VI secretion protein [Mesoterricola silvestris]